MNQYTDTGWTEDRITNLRQLQSEGWSYSQIAAALGGGLTRNACIGKAKRIGLPMRKSDHRTSDQRVVAEKKTRVRSKPKRAIFRPVHGGFHITDFMDDPGPEHAFRELPPADIPIEQRRTFVQLEEYHCRFPYGEVGHPDFFFCGAQANNGGPYCADHAQIAYRRYQPLSDRERERRRQQRIIATKIAAEAARLGD